MSQSWSIPSDWTLATALASPSARQIECLPAEPLVESQLTAVLDADAVTEVWLPVWQHRSGPPANGGAARSIRDVWVEFVDRLHAVRYEQPGGDCPLAWYWALCPIETDGSAGLIEELTARYTRLSQRPVVVSK